MSNQTGAILTQSNSVPLSGLAVHIQTKQASLGLVRHDVEETYSGASGSKVFFILQEGLTKTLQGREG